MAKQEMTVWDFVERYYPNYSSAQEIADINDLSVIIDGEIEEGTHAETLFNQLGRDIEQAEIMLVELERNAYEKAIEGYLETINKKVEKNPELAQPTIPVVQSKRRVPEVYNYQGKRYIPCQDKSDDVALIYEQVFVPKNGSPKQVIGRWYFKAMPKEQAPKPPTKMSRIKEWKKVRAGLYVEIELKSRTIQVVIPHQDATDVFIKRAQEKFPIGLEAAAQRIIGLAKQQKPRVVPISHTDEA